MTYEIHNQLQGRAGERQLARPAMGLTHKFGGVPARALRLGLAH